MLASCNSSLRSIANWTSLPANRCRCLLAGPAATSSSTATASRHQRRQRQSGSSLPFSSGSHLRVMPQSAVGDIAAAAAAGSAKAPSSDDLLIVGPGVLGSYLGKLWLDEHPGATVVGQTNTANSHDSLRALGLTPRTKLEADGRKFPFVVFAAPPSGSEDYVQEIKAAADLWDGSGSLLFTGSAGLFAVDDGSQCNEDSPVAELGISERNDRLILGERAVLEVGGNVVRLVGLYHANRGAHTFFLRMGEVQRWGGYTVNLIHYEDAASISAAILRGDGSDSFYRSKVFIGTDGSPVTFSDMMAAVEASGKYQGHTQFTGEEGDSKGKLMCNSATLRALGWRPKYSSFEDFMAAGANDWYSQQEKETAIAGAPHA